MDKILEALKNALPEDQQGQIQEVATVLQGMLDEAKQELEAEFNKNLEEAYAELEAQKTEAEEVGEQGYQEAYGIINDLRNKLETQRQEFEQTMEEQYEDAYQMILAEQAKNNDAESEIYEEYDAQFNKMKDFLVDKIDQFLHESSPQIYEQARREVVNDPRMAEHRVALNKIVETVSGFITEEEHLLGTSTKLEQAQREIDELKKQARIVEARNIRLSSQNDKLNEQVRGFNELLTEAEDDERRARQKKAQKATGRGELHTGEYRVISEEQDHQTNEEGSEVNNILTEAVGEDAAEQWKVLAGIKSEDS